MHTLDIIFLALLLLGAYLGFKRGLLMELIGFAALILAIFGAFKLLHSGVEFLNEYLPEHGNIVPFIAFIVIFIGIILLINILGQLVKRMMDLTILGAFDSVAGAILGIFKWAFLVSVVLWLTEIIHISIPEELTGESFLFPYLLNFAPKIGNYVAAVFPFADNLFESIRELFK
ncbi:MAG: CvpA family protein [Cyclobacteriaceae bacterium]|nr:CvpA family protein [Cyclobacteriaceae bacterium]